MFNNNLSLQLAVLAYVIIVARWFHVINRYHQDVLAGDDSYQYKNHPIFKGFLYLRAFTLASIAPIMAFCKPSYFAQFFDGVKVKSRAAIISNLMAVQRTAK